MRRPPSASWGATSTNGWRRWAEHFAKLGGSLDNATRAYNQAVGNLEGRVFVTARKFRELGAMAGEAELPLVGQVEQTARLLQADEMRTEESPPSVEPA